MVNWGTERLVTVENSDAGMVWAPDAIWDPAKGQYLVHWASKFVSKSTSSPGTTYSRNKQYPASDKGHTGSPGASMMRYAYTSDFKTFTQPQTLIDKSPTSIIDLSLIQLGEKSFARFLKNESATNVYMERSDTGLFGTWTRPGGGTTFIHSGVEGPYAYPDNITPGKVHLLLDYYGSDGYRPFTSTNMNANAWADASRTNFPKNLRHGSVIGIKKDRYDTLNAKWGA